MTTTQIDINYGMIEMTNQEMAAVQGGGIIEWIIRYICERLGENAAREFEYWVENTGWPAVQDYMNNMSDEERRGWETLSNCM